MTTPTPEPEPDPDDPTEADEVFEPDEHPHPLRAKDCQALLPKEIG